MKKIAIIGGGLAGLSMCTELVRNAAINNQKDIEISLFEAGDELGVGIPYSRKMNQKYLLNHEMNHMGGVNIHNAAAGEDDFYNWVQHHITALQPEYPDHDLTNANTFVPRELYGKYLKQRFSEVVEFAKENAISLKVICAEVSDVKPLRVSGMTVEYKDPKGNPQSEIVDKAVLATGHWFTSNKSLKDKPGYCMAQDVDTAISNGQIHKQNDIVILGTGQTADETALHLLEQGASHVTMMSRRGWMHAVRGAYDKNYQRKHLTLENMEQICGVGKPFTLEACLTLFNQDLEDAYGYPINWKDVYAPQNTRDTLANHLDKATTGKEMKWRSVLNSLIDIRQELYERLAPEEKTKFQNFYRTLFFCYNAPIPPVMAERLIDAMDKGKLHVQHGVESLAWNKNTQKFDIWFDDRRDVEGHALYGDENSPYEPNKDLKCLSVKTLIDARGQSRSLKEQPLLRQMLDSGTLLPNEQGGAKLNTKTHRVIGKSGENEDLYAIGAMTIGEFLINANSLVPVANAKQISRHLLASLDVEVTDSPINRFRRDPNSGHSL